MEKRKAHYDLEDIKAVVRDPTIFPFTARARREGSALGLEPQEMREVILALSRSDCFKSMTTDQDNRVWQDVYYSKTPYGQDVYIKLTLYNDGRPVVISFHKP